MLAFFYPMLSFFENQNSGARKESLDTEYYDIVLIFLFYLDVTMETIHKLFDKHHRFRDSILNN
jgi:hypothetical protein